LWLAGLTFGAPPPLMGQQVREAGVQAVATAGHEDAAVAGVYGAVRTSYRTRLSLLAGAGPSAGEPAWRVELLTHFLLNPAKTRGPALYGAAGVAAVGGPFERGYLILVVGAEGQPGAPSGWVAEAGVGGGARLAVGYRWRWFPTGWTAR
jgi:hypothetical protein